MDDPALPAPLHVRALRGLERINRWSGSLGIVWSPIQALAQAYGARPLRVLDIATGAGDVPIGLWHAARRNDCFLDIDACDRSLTALEYARERAEQARADVKFFRLDALADTIPAGYDVVISSLFLHHLGDEDIVRVLRHMAQAASQMVVVHDLARSAAGLVLAHVGTRFLSTSDVVHTDGPRSVRAALTAEEARILSQRAGLSGATVSSCWPCRLQLVWRRS